MTSATINGSASDFRHQTITKCEVSTESREGNILQASSCIAGLMALSREILSIIATSSGVYSLILKTAAARLGMLGVQ